MAPWKAAVDNGCPVLNQTVKKGTLSGQTIEFRPKARIRIDWVVRGNTLCIKDAGISTKHLLIQVKPDAVGRCHWTIESWYH